MRSNALQRGNLYTRKVCRKWCLDLQGRGAYGRLFCVLAFREFKELRDHDGVVEQLQPGGLLDGDGAEFWSQTQRGHHRRYDAFGDL